jgi:hypothetical protein
MVSLQLLVRDIVVNSRKSEERLNRWPDRRELKERVGELRLQTRLSSKLVGWC